MKSRGGFLNMLATDIQVFIPNKLEISSNVRAIWDTGATGSVISKKVVNDLGLVPVGLQKVHTANGEVIKNTYVVDIGLPNRVLIQKVLVSEVDSLASNCDVLIGMNIINLGDLSITNYEGNTWMSFRIPSQHTIDYVVEKLEHKKPPLIKPSLGGKQLPKKKKK